MIKTAIQNKKAGGAKMIEVRTEKGGEYGELGHCKYSTRNRKDKS